MIVCRYIRELIDEVWVYISRYQKRDVFDFFLRLLCTILGFMLVPVIAIIDLLLSPIEIMAIIIWKVRRIKENDTKRI